jgi:AcrR family transcriptional regulator
MSTRYTRQESQLLTRRRLIEAAAAVFARRGYRAATVAQIAEEAGFTIGAVYSNFSGKEDLFLAVVDEHLGSQLLEAARTFREATDFEEASRQLGDGAMAYLKENPEWFALFVEAWSFAVRDRDFRPRFAQRQQSSHRVLTEALRQRLEQEGVPVKDLPLENVALALKALYHGVALERATNPGSVSDDALGSVVALLLRGLLATPSPVSRSPQPSSGRRRRGRTGRVDRSG